MREKSVSLGTFSGRPWGKKKGLFNVAIKPDIAASLSIALAEAVAAYYRLDLRSKTARQAVVGLTVHTIDDKTVNLTVHRPGTSLTRW